MATSGPLPFDITAADLQTELQQLAGVGQVAISRAGPDSLGGCTWSVTFLTAQGDRPALSVTSLLTGFGAGITVAEQAKGNYINGTFKLDYNGKTTSALPYNATSEEMRIALESVVGRVMVTKSVVSSEGGAVYTVVFRGLLGDLQMLSPYSSLTGEGAVVSVREVTKGALASGSALRLFFSAPLHCSQSKVQAGECGSPVTQYSVEVLTSRATQAQVNTSSTSYVLPYYRRITHFPLTRITPIPVPYVSPIPVPLLGGDPTSSL